MATILHLLALAQPFFVGITSWWMLKTVVLHQLVDHPSIQLSMSFRQDLQSFPRFAELKGQGIEAILGPGDLLWGNLRRFVVGDDFMRSAKIGGRIW